MKTRLGSCYAVSIGLAVAWGLSWAQGALAAETPNEDTVVLKSESESKSGKEAALKKVQKQKRIVIEDLEPSEPGGAGGKREVPWLGVATQESSEALTAQLGLKAGEGLVITYLAPDSPAAKAGLARNDLLTEFEGQTLVHPAQLRKLVHMRKEGDTVSLTFYRGGKKEDVSVKLGKTKLSVGLLQEGEDWPGSLRDLKLHLGELPIGEKMREQMKHLREELSQAGIDRDSIQVQVRRSIEEARKALQEAMRQATNAHRTFGPAFREMREIVRRGVDVDKDATIVVKSDRQEIKTMVKTDDLGTYVVVANPKKHLTAHDKSGKLIFDGAVESVDQQERLPKAIWERVQPMLKELEKGAEPEVEAEEAEEDGV